jgi:hypothetical protein
LQAFFILFVSFVLLYFANETKNKQVMSIYIETISHGNTIVGVGSIWSTKKKAVNFLNMVCKEQEEQGGQIVEHDELFLSYIPKYNKNSEEVVSLLMQERLVG